LPFTGTADFLANQTCSLTGHQVSWLGIGKLLAKGKKLANTPPRRQGWMALATAFEAILDRFGWPGALLVFVAYFVEKYATLEEKRDLIELYLLGRNASSLYTHLVLGGIFIAAMLAQRHYFRKQLKIKDEELTRLGLWKTEHQEKQIGAPLHHIERK
jgi:hypothetical protein